MTLTDADLDRLEAEARNTGYALYPSDILALIAEVRRLRIAVIRAEMLPGALQSPPRSEL